MASSAHSADLLPRLNQRLAEARDQFVCCRERFPERFESLDAFADAPSIDSPALASRVEEHPPPRMVPLVNNANAQSFLPIETTPRWRTLRSRFAQYVPKNAMLLAPLLWQLEFPYHAVCRENGLPVITLPPSNIEGAAAIAAQLTIEAVVVDYATAATLSSARTSMQPRFWTLIYLADATPQRANLPGRTYAEIHIAPGVVGMYQCDTLADATDFAFHPAEDVLVECTPERTIVSLLAEDMPPVLRLALPAQFEEAAQSCDCGARVILYPRV